MMLSYNSDDDTAMTQDDTDTALALFLNLNDSLDMGCYYTDDTYVARHVHGRPGRTAPALGHTPVVVRAG